MRKLKINNPKQYAMLFWLCFFCKTITFANADLPTATKHKVVVNGLIIYLEITATPAIEGSYNFPGLAGDEKAMEINSYAFAEAAAIQLKQDGLESSKAVPPSFEFVTTPFDKAMIGLYSKLMARTKITQIKAQVFYYDGATYKHIEEIKLDGVYIESIDAKADDNNSTGIIHNVSMKYEKITKTIFAYDAGGVATPMLNSIMTWNYITHTSDL